MLRLIRTQMVSHLFATTKKPNLSMISKNKSSNSKVFSKNKTGSEQQLQQFYSNPNDNSNLNNQSINSNKNSLLKPNPSLTPNPLSTSTQTIQSFSSKKASILRLLQSTLNNLFSTRRNKILLSKTFRLFPSYFSTNTVKKLLQSQYLQQYLEYIITMKFIDREEIGNISQNRRNSRNYHSNNTNTNNNSNNNNGNGNGNKEGKGDNQKHNSNKQLCYTLDVLKMNRDYQRRILQVYINFVKRTQDLTQNQILMQIFDIRNPQNWFKSGIVGQRKFVYHHGPTNSGKTYSAINQLRALKQDQKGIYMAPLRLLAWQTQQKLGRCNLVTGQQKDYQNSNVTSCTIEAAKLNQIFDVAIIDEIQMIGDTNRGWSWTTPVLGIKANKIHLCGDQRALGLVSRLIQKCGGSLEERRYNRLSKLNLIKKNFKLGDLKPGDCIIDFSSRKLYEYREKINQMKGTPQQPTKTAIVYGKLPPVCRKVQAEKFNSGELPYLVASDAIGMGLNLKIRRIIFINLIKMANSGRDKVLEDHQIRQIAGRAGRGYGTGYVQCANPDIRQKVKYALRNVNLSIDDNVEQSENYQPITKQQLSQMNSETSKTQKVQKQSMDDKLFSDPSSVYDPFLKRYLRQDQIKVQRAGIFFPQSIIQRIKIKMQRILGQTLKTSQTIRLIIQLSKQNKQLYFVQKNEQLLQLSDQLQHLQLPFQLHYLFSQVPIPNLSRKVKQVILNFAKEFKNKGQVTIPYQIQNNYKDNFRNFINLNQIRQLQQNYMVVQAYTWLWNHLQLYFPYNNQATLIKSAICQKMNQLLTLPKDNKSNNRGKNRMSKLKNLEGNNSQKESSQFQQLIQEDKQNNINK